MLGAFNFLLAGLILLVTRGTASSGREYDMAMTLHNSAVETLQLQVRSFGAARSSMHGLEALLPALAIPAITLLVKTIRRSASRPQQ